MSLNWWGHWAYAKVPITNYYQSAYVTELVGHWAYAKVPITNYYQSAYVTELVGAQGAHN